MITNGLMSSKCDEWRTPISLFNLLDEIYNFDIDLCASDKNFLCPEYYTKDNSCLTLNCKNKKIFCNPPYGRSISLFVKKCHQLSKNNCVVMLLPARTDTKWFHEFIYGKHNVLFLKGRLKFSESKNSAPFPSMLVFMGL